MRNYFAMERYQPPIIIKSDVKQKLEEKILTEVKVQKTQEPFQEARYSAGGQRLNFDVFEQNIGCAKISMFQKKGIIKHVSFW